MASEIVKTKVKKSTKRNFYEVKSPSLTATKIFLYSSSPEELEGKTVKIDLTKNLRGKSLVLKLRVKSKGEVLEAELESIDLAISYIRRVMRKGTDYAEDSFEIECRDCSARIKYLLVTRRK